MRNVIQYILLAGWVIILAGCQKAQGPAIELADTKEESSGEFRQEDLGPTEEQQLSEGAGQAIFVYVCGAVSSPGVYELPAAARLYEAISAAGGMLDTAAVSYLNQAEALYDGQKIYVPTQEEAAGPRALEGGQPAASSGTDETSQVNINQASKEQLMTLPGIGEAKAEAVIAYREENGTFSKIEDIKNISGIGSSTFEKLKEHISVQ